MSYIDTLIQNCRKAKSVKPIRVFTINNPDELIDVNKAIYIIEEVAGDKTKTFNDFVNYKKTTERYCAKTNAPSSVLYVGSSTNNIKKRIEQHLGLGHKKTYAIHLNKWFLGTYRITIKEYNVTKEVLQLLEDDLSYELKPAFGKLGGNNRG